MKKLLIISENDKATQEIEREMKISDYEVHVFQGDFNSETDYNSQLSGVSEIVTVLGPSDSDLYFDQLFDAIFDSGVVIDHFVMVTYSGIDNEVVGGREYEGVDDVKEFIKQQRYSAKIVDEAEIPYSIIRAGKMVDGSQSALLLFAEGQPMPNGVLTYASLANFINEILADHRHINESIGVINANRG